MLLTREEEASLPLLEPLFARHLDLILETLALHLGSDPDVASLLSDDLAVARLKRSQQEYLLSVLNGENQGYSTGKRRLKRNQSAEQSPDSGQTLVARSY